jgi:hypothetical protein
VSGRAPALLASSVAERHTLRGVSYLTLAEPMPRSTVALVSRTDEQQPYAAEFIRLAAALGQVGRPAARPVLAHAA